MNINKEDAYTTIEGWIESCTNKEQLELCIKFVDYVMIQLLEDDQAATELKHRIYHLIDLLEGK